MLSGETFMTIRPTKTKVNTLALALNGKRVKVRRTSGGYTATIDLRRLTKATYTLNISGGLADGQIRRYLTCATRR